MAMKTMITLEDDLDGGPADETVRCALGGANYEIDLSAKNARVFRDQLAPFAEHARRAGRGSRRGPRTASSRERSAVAREPEPRCQASTGLAQGQMRLQMRLGRLPTTSLRGGTGHRAWSG